ncbi:MAG: hypothetical protein KDE08_12650 [Rhodobacteraceae bacterium]|nr:hypothetical protein [Paracoccaceae bacterium]
MDTDLILVAGLVTAVLSLPAMVSAFAGGRSLIGPIAFAFLGLGLIALAHWRSEEGYTPADIPHILMETVARAIR